MVPLNQARAVYLVHSSDSGESWSEPQVVFDAARALYDMVDQPTLAIGPDGSLHAAWVHAKTPGLGGSIAIEYAQSSDQGQTWTNPIIMSGAGFSRPRLAFVGEVLHLLFASDAGYSGGIYHRFVAAGQLATDSSTWSVPIAIPGWQQISPQYGLSAGSRLYLLGADLTSGQINYSTWDGERWTAEEGFEDTIQINRGVGVSAAVSEKDGQLATGWLAYRAGKDVTEPSLFMLGRQIPTVTTSNIPPLSQNESAPTLIPLSGDETATPEALLNQTSTSMPAFTPSPTPDLNRPVENGSLPLPPMVLGGVLAAMLVGIALGGFSGSDG